MKKIAVLIHSLTIEYSIEVLNGIVEYYKNKDVQLVIGAIRNPHTVIGLYEYQCWAGKSYLSSDYFDGTIVISGSFSSLMTTEELAEAVKPFTKKPIVSVSADLGLTSENYSFTKVECETTYTNIVKHLIKDHNCKKIAFFSACDTGSIEAQERFDAYKKALAENNLEYDENLILNALFTKNTAYLAAKQRYQKKEDINFDAILVANDLMAIGLIEVLNELGVRIPQDVKIIGFDDTSHAASCTPQLSTINQGIYEQGWTGAELLYKKLNNEKTTVSIQLPVKPIMRQSCGCISLDSYDRNLYKNLSGETLRKDTEQYASEKNYINFLSKLDDVYNLFDLVKSGTSLNQLFLSMKYLMKIADLTHLALCFFDKPEELTRDDIFVMPEEVNLTMFIDKQNNIELYEPGIRFKPAEEIIPNNYLENIPGNYLITPIFSGEKNYGYLLCRSLSELFSIYPLLLKILITTIAQAYEFTLLETNNNNLNLQTKTDELTKILNRRGFMDLGQKTIEIALETDNKGLVFFIDMDGLKTINDTWGHKMGDIAIKAQATVLKKALRANDVVGRLSGDEFAIIATGLSMENIPRVKEKILEYSKEISKEKQIPFTISCSFGVVEFTKEEHDLNLLLAKADSQLYIEKRKKYKR